VLQAVKAVVGRDFQAGRAIEGGGGDWEQRVVDQCRLARSGDPGDAGEQADWYFEVDLLQIVAAGALEFEQALAINRRALLRVTDFLAARQVFAGQ